MSWTEYSPVTTQFVAYRAENVNNIFFKYAHLKH